MPLTVIKASGGGTGSAFPGTNPPIYVNSGTISANVTIVTGTSGMSTGPITISDGVSVTVQDGSKWVVL